MSLKENIRSIVEDYIMDALYDSYKHSEVDKFIKNLDSEILTAEIEDFLDDVIAAAQDRITDLSEEMGGNIAEGEEDDEDEVPF